MKMGPTPLPPPWGPACPKWSHAGWGNASDGFLLLVLGLTSGLCSVQIQSQTRHFQHPRGQLLYPVWDAQG